MTLPCVFLPGWGADARTWAPLLNCLPDVECHCVDYLELEGLEDGNVDALLERLAQGLPERAVLVGWSLGGMLALALAQRYPHSVAAVLSIAAGPSFVQRDAWPCAMPVDTFESFYAQYEADAERTLRRFIGLQVQGLAGPVRKQLSRQLARDAALTADSTASHLGLLRVLAELDLRETLDELTCPVTLIYGREDALVPVEVADELQRHPTANTEVLVLDQAAHVAHLTHTEWLAKALLALLQGTSPAQNVSTRYRLDKQRVAQSFARASKHYEDYAGLQKHVAVELMVALGPIEGTLVDLGCGTGFCLEALPSALDVIGLDLALPMLERARAHYPEYSWVNADMESLPFADDSVDVFVSSLAIQWCSDERRLFSEIQRCLKPGGRFLFSSLGPDTLHELSRAWQSADPQYVHVNQFQPPQWLLQCATDSGLTLAEYSQHPQVLQYADVRSLMRDLKGIGAHNVNAGSNRGLTGKGVMSAVARAYEDERNESGMLPASYQVYYVELHKPGSR